jgi:hypothetical protein
MTVNCLYDPRYFDQTDSSVFAAFASNWPLAPAIFNLLLTPAVKTVSATILSHSDEPGKQR